MTGNGKSGRGLFSSIRKAAVATATAFSLAIGGMAVPAVSDHAAEVALLLSLICPFSRQK